MKGIRGTLGRRLPLVAILIVVVATGAVGAAMLQPPSGEQVLDNVEQRYESAESVAGTVEVVAENDTREGNATVKYVAAEGNNSRLTVTADNRTVVAGTNGTVGWVYDPSTGIAETYRNETKAEQLEDRYVELRDRYGDNVTVTRTGTELVDGTETHVLEVTSTNESIDAVGQLWVVPDEWTVRKAQVTGENGTVTAHFSDTQFNVSAHQSTFQPPTDDGDMVPGADRETYESFEAGQDATDLTVPDLRDSYDFEETIVASYEGTTTATATYDTDAGTVFVGVSTSDRFEDADAGETRTIDGQTVRVVETRRGSAAYWSDGDVTTAVVTRGPPATALDVVETVLSE